MTYALTDEKIINAAIDYGGILTKTILVYRLEAPLEEVEKALKRLIKHHMATSRSVHGMEIYDIPSAREHLSDLDERIVNTALAQGGAVRRIEIKGYNLEAVEEALKRLEVHGVLLYNSADDRYLLRGITESTTPAANNLEDLTARVSKLERQVEQLNRALQGGPLTSQSTAFQGVENLEFSSDENLTSINEKLDFFVKNLYAKGLPSRVIRSIKNDFLEFWSREGTHSLSEKMNFMIKIEREAAGEPYQVTFLSTARKSGKTVILSKRSFIAEEE